MKQRVAWMWVLVALALIAPLSRAQGQTEESAVGRVTPFHYEMSQEVTLRGTVSGVLPIAATGMLNGAHLILATPSGSFDVSLGIYALLGDGALSVALGQQVEVTGVMKNVKGAPVFLARTVSIGPRTYRIRNEHGLLISPPARERLAQKNAQSGDSL